MSWSAEVILKLSLAGAGATLFLDGAAWVRAKWFGVPGMNWGIAGRWVAGLPCGRLVLAPGDKARPPTRAEHFLGWAFHYASGVLLAALFTLLAGPEWLAAPSLLPAAGFGAATVLLPFCIMQPGLGLGLAAGRTPDPWLARRRSLITHLLFGTGLFLSAYAIAALA